MLFAPLVLWVAATEPPLEPLQPDPPASAATAPLTAAAPAVVERAHRPYSVGADAGLDIPAAGRLPMASARVTGLVHASLDDDIAAALGVRSGYSYVAGEGAAVDDVLGVDPDAFLMAHRIPVRGEARLGVRAAVLDSAAEVGIVGSVGADVALVQAHSFGRDANLTLVVPSASAGGYCTVQMGDVARVGLVGEWDSVLVDLRAAAPGVSGDLSGARLALSFSFAFGG